MRNTSLRQLVVIIVIFFFLFGDFFSIKKKIKNFMEYLNTHIFKNNRKKGT